MAVNSGHFYRTTAKVAYDAGTTPGYCYSDVYLGIIRTCTKRIRREPFGSALKNSPKKGKGIMMMTLTTKWKSGKNILMPGYWLYAPGEKEEEKSFENFVALAGPVSMSTRISIAYCQYRKDDLLLGLILLVALIVMVTSLWFR